MSFGEYLRWDGVVAVVVGASLVAVGLADGHQGLADAVMSGAMMVAGTGAFLAIRHGAPLRDVGAWFTCRPLAAASSGLAACPRPRLVANLVGEAAAMAAVTVGLSVLSGYWLTYVDFGVWAIAIGAIKLGPGSAAIAEQETRTGATYRVARRPVRGVVVLVAE